MHYTRKFPIDLRHHPKYENMSQWLFIWCVSTNHNGYSYNVYQHCKDSNLIIHKGIEALVKQMQESTIAMSIEKVVQGYSNSGFKLCNILVDGQYQHIRQIMEDKGVNGNICVKVLLTYQMCKSNLHVVTHSLWKYLQNCKTTLHWQAMFAYITPLGLTYYNWNKR